MRAHTKKIVIGDDEEISEVFNKMLKTDSVDMNVAFARYTKLKGCILSIADILQELLNSALMQKHPNMGPTKLNLEKFIGDTRAEVAAKFTLQYPGYEWNYTLLDEATQKHFTQHYLALKTSPLINQFIVCCSKLMPYKAHIGDPAKLSTDFIKSMPGTSWRPFPFSTLDILQIYNSPGVGANTLQVLVTVMHCVWKYSREIYNEVSSPDVDVGEFAAVILDNLKKIETIPELARCKMAFRKIHDSLDLLKGNFGDYYREFVVSKDSSTIMHSFLMDVQGSTDVTPELTRQFNTIINFFRKNVAKNSDDPRMKATMDKLQATMDNITRGADNLAAKSATAEEVVANPDPSTAFAGVPLQPEDPAKKGRKPGATK